MACWATIALGLVATGTACTTDSPAAGDTVPVTAAAMGVPDVTVVAFRNRGDDLSGIFTVKVSNDSPAVLRIRSVTLRTAAYRTSGAVEVDTTVAAGLRVDLKVPVGPPVCDAAAAATTATVELSLGGPDDPRPVALAREVPAEELVAWNRRECAVAEVAAVAAPALVGPWLPGVDATGRDVVSGRLRVRVADTAVGDVRITAVDQTVLFVPVETAFPVTVGAGQVVDIDVRLATGRCDPHAIAEAAAKYGFVLGVRIAVAGGEPVVVPTTVPPADRGPLYDLLDRTCGLSG